MDAALVLFYYSLCVLLASILAAALCLAGYLVSRSRVQLFAFAGLLFYFFDVALVLQDDFLAERAGALAATPYFVGSPAASIVTGGGAIASLWLAACAFIGIRSRGVRVAPPALFACASILALALVPDGNVRVLAFYSVREATLLGMALFLAVTYLRTEDDSLRLRMRRMRYPFGVFCLLVGLVVAENVVVLLVVDPAALAQAALPFFPERNFAENLLVLACAAYACRSAGKSLAARHAEPPVNSGKPVQAFVDQHLAAYRAAHGLSQREEEVLRLVLLGGDSQNIASTLSLTAGTVKVHVHNILRKTGCANRKDLARNFWEAR